MQRIKNAVLLTLMLSGVLALNPGRLQNQTARPTIHFVVARLVSLF